MINVGVLVQQVFLQCAFTMFYSQCLMKITGPPAYGKALIADIMTAVIASVFAYATVQLYFHHMGLAI